MAPRLAVPAARKVPRQKNHEGEFALRPDKIDRTFCGELPMEKYHGDACVGHSVSGSDLVVIEKKSLAHWWTQSYFNPNRLRKSSKVMDFGRSAHYLQLGEIEFAKRFVVSPYDEFRSNEAKAWRDGQELIVITKADLDRIGAMAKALASHHMAKFSFRDGKPEQSIIWQDADTGIWLKTRPDWMASESALCPNFKVSGEGDPKQWYRGAMRNLKYHMKEAMRVDGFKAIGRECKPYFVLQEDDEPYCVSIVGMRPQDLEMGRVLYRNALRKLAAGLKAKQFPGYNDGKVYIGTMPADQEADFLARMDSGEFNGLIEGTEKPEDKK